MSFPTNVADAASAIKDGVLGSFEDIMIGDLLVSALMGLSNPSELRVTDKPIELGYAIADAAVDVVRDIQMVVCFANPQYSVENLADAALSGSVDNLTETWRDKRDQLYQLQQDRELVSVTTHENIYEDMIVQLIDPIWDVDQNWDAWFGNVVLRKIKQINIATAGGLFDKAKDALGGL